jgi:hypothetical protein
VFDTIGAILKTPDYVILQGCEKVFQDTRQTGEWFSIFTRQVRKQLAKNIEMVSERGKKNPRRGSEYE